MDFIEQAAESFVMGLRIYYQDSSEKKITLSYRKLVGNLSVDSKTKLYVEILANQIQAESEGYGDGSASIAIATKAQIIWNETMQEDTGIRLQMKGIVTGLSPERGDALEVKKGEINRIKRKIH